MKDKGFPVNRLNTTTRMVADQFGSAMSDLAAQIDTEDCTPKDFASSLCNLIDVGMKSCVAVAEAAIGGPCTGGCDGTERCEGIESEEPMPSDKIPVESQPYQRSITITGPFVRVGIPSETIAPYLLTCLPNVLAPNATGFRIASRDYQLIGANFIGSVSLSSASGPDQPMTVIVAL